MLSSLFSHGHFWAKGWARLGPCSQEILGLLPGTRLSCLHVLTPRFRSTPHWHGPPNGGPLTRTMSQSMSQSWLFGSEDGGAVDTPDNLRKPLFWLWWMLESGRALSQAEGPGDKDQKPWTGVRGGSVWSIPVILSEYGSNIWATSNIFSTWRDRLVPVLDAWFQPAGAGYLLHSGWWRGCTHISDLPTATEDNFLGVKAQPIRVRHSREPKKWVEVTLLKRSHYDHYVNVYIYI